LEKELKMKTKYLIIGQGLAGTALVHTFDRNNIDFIIIDNGNDITSSKVAPGSYNPVVFKRHTLTWKVNEIFPALNEFYTNVGNLLNENIINNKNIIVRIKEKDKVEFWKKKAKTNELKKYMSLKLMSNFNDSRLIEGLGYGKINYSGILDVNTYLEKSKIYFLDNSKYIQSEFVFDDLVLETDSIQYRDIEAEHIIFCEGYRTAFNPYFFWLQFKLTKGEILTVRIKDFTQDYIIKSGIGIVPQGDDIYKISATYNWHDITERTTRGGRKYLIEKLNNYLNCDYEIINHQAGIRPTVKDRRPLLGTHPVYKNLHVFNGLGTKGVALSPYFSEHLFNYIENGKELDSEVDIKRFK